MVANSPIRVRIIPGSLQYRQLRVIRGEKSDYLCISGGRLTSIRMRSHHTPCVLSFRAMIDGQEQDVWIDKFFRNTVGRLTERRRKFIIQTAPEELEVETNERGYYKVVERDLMVWLHRFWKAGLEAAGRDSYDFAWALIGMRFDPAYAGPGWEELMSTAKKRVGTS